MNSNSVEKINNELLSHEETIELIIKAQNGDGEAQRKLVERNIGLVRSVLKRFSNRGYDSEDLFQLGSIGLIKSIQKFDIKYEVRFSTYAVPMIIGEIKRFLRDDGIIKVSRTLKQTSTRVKMIGELLTRKLGRQPTLEEIASEMNIDREEIVMALESSYQPEYLYDVIHQNDGAPIYLIDKISDKNEKVEIVDKISLKEVINKLKPRDRQVIIMRYFKDKTQTEIAKMLGISQVQVSRIEKKVLADMKESLTKV